MPQGVEARRVEALLLASAAVEEPAATGRREARPLLAPEPDPGHARYLVRRGESFWSIAERNYGSGRYSQALWAANRGKVTAPDRLSVGMAIAIPPVDDLDPAFHPRGVNQPVGAAATATRRERFRTDEPPAPD